jgi:hypothetical protein
MAFKLKSPFHVTPMGQTLAKGGTKSGYSGPSNIVSSVANIDYAETEGTQNLNPPPSNKTTENLVKKAEKGIPENLNPKQKAKRETKDYKKGLKADAKFDRQTEKAKKIYERNQFEAVGKDGAYVNPDEAAGIKSDRAEKSLEQDSKFKILDSDLTFEEKEKMINDIDSKSKFSNNKIIDDEKEKTPPKDNLVMRNKEEEFKNPLLKMKGKPNRAGTPVRMLRSVEDPTPMKYKSVRKAGRENLMSALAKQGEPIGKNDLGTPGGRPYSIEKKPLKPTSEIKSNPNFATPGTGFEATDPNKSNQPKRTTVGDRAKESVKKAVKLSVGAAALKKGEPKKKEMVNDFTMNMDDSISLELPKPVKKMRPKKVKNKNRKSTTGSGNVKTRKVSTKF